MGLSVPLMSVEAKLPIAFTCGDPAGIGPEIVAKWLTEHQDELDDVCVIGPKQWLRGLGGPKHVCVGDADFSAIPGKPTQAGAAIAIAALEEAADGCQEGRHRSVVTAPISKIELDRVGWDFPGQTEYFAKKWGGEPTMAFAGGEMRVALATRHISLAEVESSLSRELLRKTISDAHLMAQPLGGKKHPKVGVCGLNPHAGENGLIGCEERDWIDPFLSTLRQEFPGVSLSLPADTLFWRHLRGEFDVVVAMYHDQGLIPLKTIDFDSAVNISLGLPFLRTSPDHGTAFNIAGKGIASTTSFSNAVCLARKLCA